MTKKELKKIRMNNMKLLPMKKTEYIKNKISHIKVAYFILCKYKTIIEYAIIKLRFSDDIK